MRTNIAIKRDPILTHEDGQAAHITPIKQLRRSVLSCLLYEKEFYENGMSIADRVREEAQNVPVAVLAALAVEARTHFNLRHMPLYLTALLAQRARGSSIISETLRDVIQRADELTEFLAIYARVNGVTPDKIKPKLSNQVRKGLAMAFQKFQEYHLAKWDRQGAIKLKDALFLCHARPVNDEQKALWERLINDQLATPDTWEVIISAAGSDPDAKRVAWERVVDTWITEGDSGLRIGNHMAILRNLRNVLETGVSDAHMAKVRQALCSSEWARGARRVLPFRYVAAARVAPMLEPELDHALVASIQNLPRLPGRTVALVDVSGSMDDKLSAKSDMSRLDAAATLASMINAESLRVFTFSNALVEVPARRGMAGVDAIRNSQSHQGTQLFSAVQRLNETVSHDRLIIVTDEQAHGPHAGWYAAYAGYFASPSSRPERMPDPVCENGYVINVASAQNGVGYGKWTHLDGMSEQVLRWIPEYEDIASLQEAR